MTRFYPLQSGAFTLSSGFRTADRPDHAGLDFAAQDGTPFYACQAGTVLFIGRADGYGQWIVLDHDDSQGSGVTEYGHMWNAFATGLKVGDRVEAGQLIGYVGSNGESSGPHLHLAVMPRGYAPRTKIDPAAWLQGARYPGVAAPQPNPGPAPEAPGTLYGIDVSNHQGAFNFAQARAEGFRFATHKVTEGDGYCDPQWPRAREQMREHFPGLFGGYVFCRRSSHPEREADLLLKHLGDASIPIQLDYEDTDGGGSVADMWARIHAIEARGMRVFATYLPRWFWQSRMGEAALGDVPGLWNSHYVLGTGFASTLYETSPGTIERGWAPFHPGSPAVEILQFTEKAKVAGQSIDANAFRGTETQLRALFAGRPAIQEDDMTEDDRRMLREIHAALFGEDGLKAAITEEKESLIKIGDNPPAKLSLPEFIRCTDAATFRTERAAESMQGDITGIKQDITGIQGTLADIQTKLGKGAQ